MVPPRSPHQNCRESRPVPFFPQGEVWEGVAGGIVNSVDIDENMQFSPAELFVPPFQLQEAPSIPRVASMARLPRRVVLAPLDANVKTLSREIKRMEKENADLRKHVKRQDDLIKGFCRLHLGQ